MLSSNMQLLNWTVPTQNIFMFKDCATRQDSSKHFKYININVYSNLMRRVISNCLYVKSGV